jgi:succinoglycan biosynthesis transport protein ExoP
MNLIQFIKLLFRNALLLIASGLILSAAVFLFLINAPKSYESTTTIYTGIGTSLNLENTSITDFYGTNMAFDNLLNIISSRETLEEVSLRLLAKHLLLEKADPKYITQENYDEIMSMIPEDVMDLLVKENADQEEEVAAVDSSESKQTTVKEDKKTIYHVVQPDETLYSISRRYNIPLITLMRMNKLDDNIIKAGEKLIIQQAEAASPQITDNENLEEDNQYIYYNVEHDDDISTIAKRFNTSTKDLIIWNGLTERKLIAGQRIIVGEKTESADTKYTPDYSEAEVVDPNSEYIDLSKVDVKNNKEVGQSSLQERLEKEFDNSYALEQTLKNFYTYKEKSDTNFIYELLNYNYKHYSIAALQSIRVERLENSDIIELTYESDDPGVCQYTLILLSHIFIKNYKLIKENQSDAVIKYFEEQTQRANERLQKAEDELLHFNKENAIINYNEQTKYIAAKKEDLDESFQEEKMEYASAKASVKRLEEQLNTQSEVFLNNTKMLSLRDQLTKATNKLTYKKTEINPDASTQREIEALETEIADLKKQMDQAVNDAYVLSNTKEGVTSKQLLDQWLQAVISFEESKARLEVFGERQAEFQEIYNKFAPLGAKLKRIEREINVAEQEYLQLLNSLNLSKLKQQNIELSSNIKPVGFPFYPITPKSEKKKIILAISFLAGILLCAFAIILLEVFDTNLNNPERVKKFTRRDTAVAFPFFPSRHGKIDYTLIRNRLTELLIQDIKLQTASIKGKPIVIGMFSPLSEEGKSMITSGLVQKIRESGDKVLHLSYDLEENHEDDISYATHIKFPDTQKIESLNNKIGLTAKYQFIFIEFPSLIMHSNPSEIIKQLDASYIVCQAKRKWKDADQKVCETLDSLTKNKSKIILNASKLDVVEDFISEVPRKRSAIRRFFKNILTPNAK